MNALKWLLSSAQKKDDSKQSSEQTTIRDLIDQVCEEHKKLEAIEKEHHFQKLQLDMQNGVLDKTRNDITQYKSTIAALEKTLATRDQTIHRISTDNTNKQRQINQLQNSAKSAKDSQRSLRNENTTLKTSITNMGNAQLHLTETLKDLEISRQTNIDLQFDLELLKCSTQPEKHVEMGHTAESTQLSDPFVLVLVDGDAYEWGASHFLQKSGPPGFHAAQAIKNEVQKYLIAHKERIPIQSRIVARVFMNIAGTSREAKQSFFQSSVKEFAKGFTESTPLFDFFDAGDGKERVDEKIKATFQLFISNPSCHAIFFAAARDNGFARLLEQYACLPDLKSKIIIVHPGYVARELALLGYASMEWSGVFKRQHMPFDESQKERKIAAAKKRTVEESKKAFIADVASTYTQKIALTPLTNTSVGYYDIYRKPQMAEPLRSEREDSEVVEELD